MKTTQRKDARTGSKGMRSRIFLTLAFAALSAGLLLGPARAQHEQPAPQQTAPAAQPATEGARTESHEGGPTQSGTHDTAPHTGVGGTHQEGTHESAAPGAESHAAGEEHAAAGEHAEGGEHGEEHEATHIEHPSWITGLLKKFWFSGPATLTADAALDPSGNVLDPAALQGQKIDFKYEDEESESKPKPEYDIHPTIGTVGKFAAPGAHTEAVQVGGQAVTLVNPKVAFAWQSMFPELLVISLLTALGLFGFGVLFTRNMQRVPGKRQMLVEEVYKFLDNFVSGLIPGEAYKRYLPLVATLFLYILFMNLAGLIPGWKSPTANINVTAGLAIVVILYVQYEGIRVNGFGGYLLHFVGEPRWLGPLNFPLHIIGEAARVLSLTVRLFGNIFGEDVVVAILILLAAMFTKGFVPFQMPMYLLGIFTSIVQAMVFCILTSVYIALMTTHEDHGHGHGHGEERGHGDHGHEHGVDLAPRPAV